MSDPDRDGGRDAWLSHALRHAPDADATAPSALSESILAQARAVAVRAAASRAKPEGRTLVELLRSGWIALARPPVAAAFASVMAATLVGLMWWDRPMDETLPRPPAPVAHGIPATPLPAPQASVTESARVPLEGPAPTPAPADAESSKSPSPARDRNANRERAASGRVAAPPPAPAPAPAPKPESPAAFSMTEPRSDAERDRSQEAKKDAAARSEIAADRADKSTAGHAAPGSEPQAGAMAAPRQRSAADARENADAVERQPPARPASPLAALLESVAREPQRWTVQAGAGSPTEIDPAWRGWLADVDGAAAGRWQRAGNAASADDERRNGAPIRLILDGRAAAVLRVDGRTVQLDDLLGHPLEHWQASLVPAAASRLAAGRARLPP